MNKLEKLLHTDAIELEKNIDELKIKLQKIYSEINETDAVDYAKNKILKLIDENYSDFREIGRHQENGRYQCINLPIEKHDLIIQYLDILCEMAKKGKTT